MTKNSYCKKKGGAKIAEKKFIKHFCRLSKRGRIEILKKISNQQVDYILAIFDRLGSKKKNCLPPSIKKELNRGDYATKVKTLARGARLSKIKKGKLIKNIKTIEGGFWPVLLSTILPIAAKVVYEKFSKAE